MQESKRFAAVDRSWKSIMKRTYNHPKALEAGTIKGLKETLVRHNEVLEGIQKSLENYLEKKRCVRQILLHLTHGCLNGRLPLNHRYFRLPSRSFHSCMLLLARRVLQVHVSSVLLPVQRRAA